MPGRISVCGAIAGIFLVFAPLDARANVVGSDAQNFNPTSSGLDFVTVQSSETLEPGVFNFGLFVNYAKNSLPFYNAGVQTTRAESSLTGGDFNLGVGLGKNWDVGLSFPVILNQQVAETANVGRYSATGNTEIRVNSKYRLFGESDHGVALIGSLNFNRINDNPYVGSGGGPIYNLELAADTTLSDFALALNLGYRWRNPGSAVANSGIQPLPNQMLASAAISYFVESMDSKIIFEILSALPEKSVAGGATDRENSVLEALLGLKYDSKSDFSFHIGAGQGLAKGISSPDLRVYTGINYSFGGGSDKKAMAKDPYYENKRLVRFQQKKAAAKQQVAAQTAPAPEDLSADLEMPSAPSVAAEPVQPATSVETVRDVPVFNRSSYRHIVLKNLEFQRRSKNLVAESERYMKQELIPALRELHRRRPIGSIVVEGHTDSLGSSAANMALSLERARIVANVLNTSLHLKIPAQAVGLGSTSPLADNGNFQGRALNNRVEFKLLYKKTSR